MGDKEAGRHVSYELGGLCRTPVDVLEYGENV